MQASTSEALGLLQAAVRGADSTYGGYASGLVRFEVPIPRSINALRWLQGQPQTEPCLQPRVYFSPRRSSAPDTVGGRVAEEASKGSGAVSGAFLSPCPDPKGTETLVANSDVISVQFWKCDAAPHLLCPSFSGTLQQILSVVFGLSGAGAAWSWQGEEGQALDGAAIQAMQNFLSASCTRVRVLGGTRFNQAQSPAEEWREFGSYIFILPRWVCPRDTSHCPNFRDGVWH